MQLRDLMARHVDTFMYKTTECIHLLSTNTQKHEVTQSSNCTIAGIEHVYQTIFTDPAVIFVIMVNLA